MKIGIGIDTGGTYTDAVIYGFEDKVILGTSKALTTKDDLSIGIIQALDMLPQDILQQASVVSLSTTLATNACVEDKAGNAKLILFGGYVDLVDELGESLGLPPSKDILMLDSYTHFSGLIDREPDWDQFIAATSTGFDQLDGVGIVEMNAIRNGAVVEKKAKQIFASRHSVPVVCGYELFSELSCLQRCSSTLLNASLFPIIKEFLSAMKTALTNRGISATVVIVRSDGSLMSVDYALSHPVETLLCGPAASVIGGNQLAKEEKAIIIDMGGTTTDIAMIKDGLPVTVLDGVRIGKWKTLVNGLYIKTFGLGGDTAIHYADRKLFLEDYRITPLCVAAQKYPGILGNLKTLIESENTHTMFLYEHYLLVKDIQNSSRYTDTEKAFCRVLKNGPVILREAAAAIGTDIFNINVSRLIKNGVVQMCGLTPTDIMHIRGDFDQFSKEASLLAAKYVARNLQISIDALCERVYDEIKQKLYCNVVSMILENKYKQYRSTGIGKDIELFIHESYQLAASGDKDEYISMGFKTDFKLLGVGAPIKIFLDDVAKMLGTSAIIPTHYEVANALGAVVGNVVATHSVSIRSQNELKGPQFAVYGNDTIKMFNELDSAVAFAEEEARAGVLAEALARGAKGDISVSVRVDHDDCALDTGTVYLGTTVVAQAIGSAGL